MATLEALPELATVEEVCSALNMPVHLYYRGVRAGSLPGVAVGERLIRVPTAALRKVLSGEGIDPSLLNISEQRERARAAAYTPRPRTRRAAKRAATK